MSYVNKSRSRRFISWLTSLIILVAVGGGIYLWQHHQVDNLQRQVASLRQAQKQNAPNQPAATPVASAVPCTTAELSLSVGQASGTAGTTYQDMVLTNTSSHSCTLDGYPQVVLVDGSGQQLGQPATENSANAPSTVTLLAGQTAHAAVGFPDPANFDPAACSAKAADLQLTPPGETTALRVAATDQYCPGFSTTVIQPGS